MWAPARIRSRTISQNPSWAARNKAPVPVFLWWSIYYFNWFKIGKEFKIFTFRRWEGLAPCRSSSRQHSKCPAAAVIINGVVPSWIKEKHNKSAVLHVLSVIIQKRKLLSNGYISLLLYRPTFSRGSYIIIQRDRPFVFSHLLHLFFFFSFYTTRLTAYCRAFDTLQWCRSFFFYYLYNNIYVADRYFLRLCFFSL